LTKEYSNQKVLGGNLNSGGLGNPEDLNSIDDFDPNDTSGMILPIDIQIRIEKKPREFETIERPYYS